MSLELAQGSLPSVQSSPPAVRLGELVCASPAMQTVAREICRPGLSLLPVLITGESGVGKELVARALHDTSPRAEGPFVPVNCAALPRELFESELFGHRRGAFTGATAERAGVFVEAHGGTIFFDELGELPLALQPKLLRVLETMTVRPVGATQERAIDVRVVAATNRCLADMVDEGTFRADLLYRLDVLSFEIPPLRDRPEDVRALVPLLLARFGLKREVAPGAMLALEGHGWPGNVRELRNVLLRAAQRTSTRIGAEDIGLALWRGQPGGPAQRTMRHDTFRYASETLAANRGHRRRTYEQLGVPRSTFYRWLRQGRLRDVGAWRFHHRE